MKTNTKVQACIIPCCIILGSAIAAGQVTFKFALEPPAGANGLGTAIVGLGDINGDGIPDFATSDPGNTRVSNGVTLTQTGTVYVVSGADGEILHELQGNPAISQRFGLSLAAADLNKEGHADLVIAAPGSRSVWVFSGIDFSLLYQVTGLAGESRDPISLATIGDLNGDGVTDLLVGTPTVSPGSVTVRSGANGGLLRTIAGSAFDNPFGAQFGAALAALPDLDDDGLPDIAIGAPAGAGRVTFHSSADGSLIDAFTGTVEAARLGFSLASGGDLDGDGVGDLLVGSGRHGTCLVLSSATREILADFSVADCSTERPIFAGGSTDLDGDGVPDWIVGFPGNSVGSVEVISGKDGAVLLQLKANAVDTSFGSTVALIDGLGFVVAENRYISPDTGGGGRVLVFAFDEDAEVPTLVFGDVDSGVKDRLDADGVSLADRFAALEPADGWENHGHFVSTAGRLIRDLLSEGVIDDAEAELLKSAAARSNVGKP